LTRVITASGTGAATRFGYTSTGNTLATDGAASYSRDPAGGLIGVKTGQTGVLALTDQHTDVVGEFTATGTALAGSATYDPLGNVTASANLAGNLGYQSGWTDHATGRVNMAARWYNPTTGQFDNRDSVGVSPLPNPMAANRYAYADDNPLTNTDPTGHCAINDDGDLCVGHRVVGGLPQTGPITTPTHNTLRCTDGDCRVSPAPRAVTGTTPNHPNDASHKNSLISACAKICPYFGGANGILVTSAHRGSGEKYADEHVVLELMDWIPLVDQVVLTRDHDLYVKEGNNKAAESIETALGLAQWMRGSPKARQCLWKASPSGQQSERQRVAGPEKPSFHSSVKPKKPRPTKTGNSSNNSARPATATHPSATPHPAAADPPEARHRAADLIPAAAMPGAPKAPAARRPRATRRPGQRQSVTNRPPSSPRPRTMSPQPARPSPAATASTRQPRS
jgi:RHS repeat-associated protein